MILKNNNIEKLWIWKYQANTVACSQKPLVTLKPIGFPQIEKQEKQELVNHHKHTQKPPNSLYFVK